MVHGWMDVCPAIAKVPGTRILNASDGKMQIINVILVLKNSTGTGILVHTGVGYKIYFILHCRILVPV